MVGNISSATAQENHPRSIDPNVKIELFAEHPQIVTPTGIDVDRKGRIWAIESNTHFAPEGYKGHPTDRVLVMTDTDGDGRADRVVVFTDGLRHTMSIAVRPVSKPLAPANGDDKPASGDRNDDKKNRRLEKDAVANDAPKHPQARASAMPAVSVFIATRRAISLFHDDDGDDKADRREPIIQLKTTGDYPHNGLAGFAFDAAGWMYFGFGENLGADYKIIGTDGTSLSGGGEGGSLCRCRLDGSQLERWATGFWNPHASCFDALGRLFTVDNDPDSRPPCRLLHIIRGGDYGYRFRNGRAGLHPFTSWNGEIPGTLPMVAGTGEAPSGILACDSYSLPEDYRGNLLVTSWGDHRIDRFRLKPHGASFTSLADPLIVGGETFRPVGIAGSPDGSLYCTDWVKRDYTLHGHGRVWRISALKPKVDTRKPTGEPDPIVASVPPSTVNSPDREVWRQAALPKDQAAVRERAQDLLADRLAGQSPQPADGAALLSILSQCKLRPGDTLIPLALALDDPFVLSIMASTLARDFTSPEFIEYLTPGSAATARVRVAMVLAARQHDRRDSALVEIALTDDDPDVRRLAVQWAAEEKLSDLRPRVEAVFNSNAVTSDLFLATLAALEMLDGVNPAHFDKTPTAQYVLPLLRDATRPASVRAQALRLVAPGDPALDARLMAAFLNDSDRLLRQEAVRTLQLAPPERAAPLLISFAADARQDQELRADAVAALAGAAASEKPGGPARRLLTELLTADTGVLRRESLRSVRRLVTHDPGLQQGVLLLGKYLDSSNAVTDAVHELADQIALALADKKDSLSAAVKRLQSKRPANKAEWLAQLNRGDDVDVEAGRRLFYHANGPGCSKCHTVNGRGGRVGPDLSRVVDSRNRGQLIQSILEPGSEIAPQYVAWAFETIDGKVHTGMIVHENEGKTIVGDAEGRLTELKTIDIVARVAQQKSIMPEKLPELMTLQEFRDLIAYLESLK